MAGEGFAVHFVFGIFRRLDRKFIQALQAQYSIADLERRLGDSRQKRAIRALFGLFLFFGMTALLIYGGYRLAVAYAQRDPDMRVFFGFTPQLLGGGLLGFTAALFAALLLEFVSTRLVYGDRSHEYIVLECLRYGFNIYRRTLQLMVVLGAPMLILALLSLDTYTFATSNAVVLNPYWGIGETRYPFSQIQSLEERSLIANTKHGPKRQVYHEIDFRDGHVWQSHSGGGDVAPRTQWEGRDLVDFLSKQTGLPIVKAPMDP